MSLKAFTCLRQEEMEMAKLEAAASLAALLGQSDPSLKAQLESSEKRVQACAQAFFSAVQPQRLDALKEIAASSLSSKESTYFLYYAAFAQKSPAIHTGPVMPLRTLFDYLSAAERELENAQAAHDTREGVGLLCQVLGKSLPAEMQKPDKTQQKTLRSAQIIACTFATTLKELQGNPAYPDLHISLRPLLPPHAFYRFTLYATLAGCSPPADTDTRLSPDGTYAAQSEGVSPATPEGFVSPVLR